MRAIVVSHAFDAFLKLPALQRKLIGEVILTFAKAHSDNIENKPN